MSNCILCSQPLGTDVKPEHVWLESLGGRKSTRRVLCSDCNQRMGSGPDKMLADSVAFLRNMMNFPDGKGKSPPSIRGHQHDYRPIALQPGAVPVPAGGPPFVITTLPDGNQNVEVRLGADDPEGDLQRLLPHLAGALRISEEQVREMLKGSQFERVSQRVETQHHRLSLGGPEPMRSMLKTCLTLWADRHGTAELFKSIYDDARRFVRFGDETLVGKIACLTTGNLATEVAFLDRYGPYFNLACVASNTEGRVIGYFRLYNICGWRFVLCEAGGIPSSTAGLISNPADPRIWQSLTEQQPFSYEFLMGLGEVEFATARQALASMLETYFDKAAEREIGNTVEATIADHGLKEGDILTEGFFRDLSDRTARWIMGLEHRRPILYDTRERLLGKPPKE